MVAKRIAFPILALVIALALLILTHQVVLAGTSSTPFGGHDSVLLMPQAAPELPAPLLQGSLAGTLQAASLETIEFRTQNGETVNNVPPKLVKRQLEMDIDDN